MRPLPIAGLAAAAALSALPALAQPSLADVACETPPAAHCGPGECALATLRMAGNAVDPATGRRFFLDYPCDLKPGDKVVFILNLHGAGSNGNWQRHYFPAMDLKERYRLIVATPTAATSTALAPGAPPVRMWAPDADDAHLRNIVGLVYARFGHDRIRRFWVAGHSQGGMTANRIVCGQLPEKVDGWLSLSGGRIGAVQPAAGFGPPAPPGAPPPSLPGGARLGAATTPACDLDYIFESGDREIQALPETSPWAEKYRCATRVRRPDVVDDRAGYVFDTRPQPGASPAWGTRPRPGTAEVMVYPKCRGGRLVADVLRLDKGHTEGLEPKVTEALVAMMTGPVRR